MSYFHIVCKENLNATMAVGRWMIAMKKKKGTMTGRGKNFLCLCFVPSSVKHVLLPS